MPDIPQVLTPNTWPVGTEVVLLQVPWDANYRDIVIWDNQKQRDDYFDGAYSCDSKRWTSAKFSYLPPNEPINIPVPYSAAYKYNYVVVQNPMQPVEYEEQPIRLCYFITSASYINPQTTMITLQLDVIQTYQFGVSIDRLFAVSGHAAISNTAMNQSLTAITGNVLRRYCDIDEGVSVGNTYAIIGKEWFPFTEPDSGELGWVIVTSTANLAADPGTIDSPNLNVADGQSADGLPSGCNVYSMRQTVFKQFMAALQQKSWVAQCIVSVTTFPSRLLSAGPEVELFGNSGVMMHFIGDTDALTGKRYIEITDIYKKLSDWGFGQDYTLQPYKKLLCYPYSVIELTTYSGNSIFLRPELLWGSKISLLAVCCAIAPFARIAMVPTLYNCNGSDESFEDDTYQFVRLGDGKPSTCVIGSGDFLDTALWLTDFPQFSIVNNNYITYMASTTNTRQYQYSNAAWSLDKSNMGAQNAYNNAMLGANTTQANFDASASGLANAIGQLAVTAPVVSQDGIGGWASPSIGGLVNGALGNAMGQIGANSWGSAQDIVGNMTGATQNANNVNLARQVAGNNLNLANQVNQGDYENAIRGINAAYQDAQLTPPSTAGQLGGNGFMWKNGLSGFGVVYKQAYGSAFQGACDYMLRYGNQIHRYINIKGGMTKLKVMKKFSYWKASETYIDCAKANEAEKDVIRGILERGVTVWGKPEDIKHTELRPSDPAEYNAPLYNISY